MRIYHPGDPFRPDDANERREPFDAAKSMQEARVARASAVARPWVASFSQEAATAGLSIVLFNTILAESDTLDAARVALARYIASGAGNPALRKPAQIETANRLKATIAKAHSGEFGRQH